LSSKFGIDFRLNRYYVEAATDKWANVGGIPRPCRPEKSVRTLAEEGTGQRRAISVDIAEIRSRLALTMNVQRIAGYLEDYCIAAGEAALPSHDLHWTDGLDNQELSDSKCGRIAFAVDHGGFLTADLEFAGKDMVDHGKTPVWEILPDKVLSFRNITEVKIGANVVTNWKRLAWNLNHRIMEESLGNDPKTAEVQEGLAEYSVAITLSRKDASQLGNVGAGQTASVEIAITDNQATPAIRRFKFSEAVMSLSRIDAPGQGLELEEIE